MTPVASNINLVESCRRGDPKAQLQIYRLYFRQMFNISYNLVNNADAADEIVKESFFFTFEMISTNKRQSDIFTCLKKLVIQRSLEILSKSNTAFPGLTTDRLLAE